MPPWVLHFLVNVVKRCCLVVIKYIKRLEENEQSPIDPWAMDFLTNVVKNSCSITIEYIEKLREKERGW